MSQTKKTILFNVNPSNTNNLKYSKKTKKIKPKININTSAIRDRFIKQVKEHRKDNLLNQK